MSTKRGRRGVLSRNAFGPGDAEAFILIATATILITRLYLKLSRYPQVGGGSLHIAHTTYGNLLMMLALLTGWLALGVGARKFAVVLGGVGLGLVLDEVGKFVTKDNDYFYGPAAEIMYVVVTIVLLGARTLRDIRPLAANEYLASATVLAADGVARGLGDRRRENALRPRPRAGCSSRLAPYRAISFTFTTRSASARGCNSCTKLPDTIDKPFGGDPLGGEQPDELCGRADVGDAPNVCAGVERAPVHERGESLVSGRLGDRKR